jgi:hypothetical protein
MHGTNMDLHSLNPTIVMLSNAKHPRMSTSIDCSGKQTGPLCFCDCTSDAQPEIPSWPKDSQRSAQNDNG